MLKKEWFISQDYRKSTRTYIDNSIAEDDIEKLKKLIYEINNKSNLNFQFVKDCSDLFNGFKASYGLLKGVNSCIALVGNKNISQYKNNIGYYGEMLVLEATNMGLGTCWIGGTYNRNECKKYININDGEELVCVISIGYISSRDNLLQKFVSRVNKKRKDFNDILLEKDKEAPKWVISGINSVIKAPSALNKKPIGYTFKNNIIKAYTTKKNYDLEEVDLGISMLHFELGSKNEGYCGEWEYVSSENIYEFKRL